jgi:hypothetical protein
VQLVRLVDLIPVREPPPRGRGRPRYYPDRLLLKALLVMVLRRLPKVGTPLAVLEQDSPRWPRCGRS